MVEVCEEARGFFVELGVDAVKVVEPGAAVAAGVGVFSVGGEGGGDFFDEVAAIADELGDVGFEGGEGVDDELGVVCGVMAAPAEGGDVVGIFEGAAKGEKPGGGDATVRGCGGVGEVGEEAVGDLVIECAADAVDEDVGEEEADEEGEGEGARADDEVFVAGEDGIDGEFGVVVEEDGAGGGLADGQALAGFTQTVDPEGEFPLGGGAGEVGHGVLGVFDALARAVGGEVAVVEGGPLGGVRDPGADEEVPRLSGTGKARGHMMHMDVEGVFNLRTCLRQPLGIRTLRRGTQGGHEHGESIGVRLRMASDGGVPVLEGVVVGSMERFSGQGVGGCELHLSSLPPPPPTHRLIAPCGDIEAALVNDVVIHEQIEGDRTGDALRQFIRGEDLDPDACVVELQLVAGDDPGAFERVSAGGRGLNESGPCGGGLEEMGTGFFPQLSEGGGGEFGGIEEWARAEGVFQDGEGRFNEHLAVPAGHDDFGGIGMNRIRGSSGGRSHAWFIIPTASRITTHGTLTLLIPCTPPTAAQFAALHHGFADGLQLRGQHFYVMLEASGGIIEDASEMAGGVFIDQFDGQFLNDEVVGVALGPELHGKGVPGNGEVEAFHGGDAVGFEAAEGVGHLCGGMGSAKLEMEGGVEEFRDEPIDVAAIGGRDAEVVIGGLEVARSGDDVGLIVEAFADEEGNAAGFVLLVAVHGDDPVVAVGGGIGEGVDKGLAVAAVFGMSEEFDVASVGEIAEEGGGGVGGAIIDHEDAGVDRGFGERGSAGVFADLAQDAGDVFFFIEDGDRDQNLHHAPALNHPGAGHMCNASPGAGDVNAVLMGFYTVRELLQCRLGSPHHKRRLSFTLEIG